MESCQKCGHIRYAGDLFDGGCSDCCDWMVARLAELTAERDKANREAEQSATECLEWREKAKVWLASPEAGERLAGYRELADRLAAVTKERDALKAKVEAAWKYQDIVYAVCNELDRATGRSVRTGTGLVADKDEIIGALRSAILNGAREGGE